MLKVPPSKMKTAVFLILFCLVSASALPFSKQVADKKIQQAIEREEAGNYEAAQDLYEEVLKESPDYEPALFGLAQVFYWKGNYERSLDTYLKLLEKNPDHLDALLGISKVYLAMGNQKKAQEYLVKAQKIDPEKEEVQELGTQMGKKTKIRVQGGYTIINPNYTTDTQAEFQELSISKEERYGFGIKTLYLRKFNRNGFETSLLGNYYIKGKTRIDAGLSFAPDVNILPKAGYTAGLSHSIWKITPEVHYTFQDYSQANLHFLRAGVSFDPISFLRVGGGYEFHRLSAGANTRNLKGGFANFKLSPLEWLSVHGFYERVQRGFEAGRAPSPFVTYSSHVGGGGISLDFIASYSITFNASTEKRGNGDNIVAYTLGFGFNF